jgi:hypothetical protein
VADVNVHCLPMNSTSFIEGADAFSFARCRGRGRFRGAMARAQAELDYNRDVRPNPVGELLRLPRL